MAIRVLIADDHTVVRQGLRMFLALDPGLEVIGEAANGEEALHLARTLHPDVVMMDLMMPRMDGIQATELIRKELPDVQIIALTSVLEDDAVVKGNKDAYTTGVTKGNPGKQGAPSSGDPIIAAMRAGAIGYLNLLKDMEAEAVCQAVRAVAAGQVQLSAQAAERLLREVRSPEKAMGLTQRETDTLRLVAQGLANKEIAAILEISETTVKTHVSNILAKLGVPSRTQAALYAVRAGLVPNLSFQDG